MLATAQRTPLKDQTRFVQLGRATGTVINPGVQLPDGCAGVHPHLPGLVRHCGIRRPRARGMACRLTVGGPRPAPDRAAQWRSCWSFGRSGGAAACWLVGWSVRVVVLVGLGGATRATDKATRWGPTSVTIETPRSQLVTAAPGGADKLGVARAAARAPDGHRRLDQASWPAPRSERQTKSWSWTQTSSVPLGSDVDGAGSHQGREHVLAPYMLTVFLQNTSLPMISIEAAAADKAKARRLASAAVAVLKAESSHGGPLEELVKTNAGVLGLQPFVVTQVLPLTTKVVSSIDLPIKAIVGHCSCSRCGALARVCCRRAEGRGRRRLRRVAQPA